MSSGGSLQKERCSRGTFTWPKNSFDVLLHLLRTFTNHFTAHSILRDSCHLVTIYFTVALREALQDHQSKNKQPDKQFLSQSCHCTQCCTNPKHLSHSSYLPDIVKYTGGLCNICIVYVFTVFNIL